MKVSSGMQMWLSLRMNSYLKFFSILLIAWNDFFFFKNIGKKRFSFFSLLFPKVSFPLGRAVWICVLISGKWYRILIFQLELKTCHLFGVIVEGEFLFGFDFVSSSFDDKSFNIFLWCFHLACWSWFTESSCVSQAKASPCSFTFMIRSP